MQTRTIYKNQGGYYEAAVMYGDCSDKYKRLVFTKFPTAFGHKNDNYYPLEFTGNDTWE